VGDEGEPGLLGGTSSRTANQIGTAHVMISRTRRVCK